MIHRITGHVKQLFTLQMNHHIESVQATSGPPGDKVGHAHTKSQEMASMPRVLSTLNSAPKKVQVNEPKEAGQSEASITRYLLLSALSLQMLNFREIDTNTGQCALSSNSPKPLLAGSVKELIKKIEAWICDHGGERPPASLVYRKPDIKEHVIKEVQLTIGPGSGWVRRFQINNQWMAWMIEDKNGRCMLAKPTMKHCNSGFQAWLGGDRGFTSATVARLVKPANPSKTLGSELIDSEDDGSEGDDVFGRSSRNGSCYIRPEKLNDTLASPPQLQSLPRIKRARVPIDYTVPALLPSSTRLSRNVHQQPHSTKRRKATGRSDSSHSSSPSVMSVSAGPPALRPSHAIKQEPVASSVSSRDPVMAIHSHGLAPTSSTETPADTVSDTRPASSSSIPLKIASKITFHFFLSDADLGAIPQDFVHCNNFTSFFNQALEAWEILGGEDRNTIMTAVSVVLVSVDWPIVIPWRNKDGFEMMMGIVTKAAMGNQEHLDVKVKCMRHA